MTTTQQIAQAFDTKLAELHGRHDEIVARIAKAEELAHREAGDKRRYVGSRPVWQLSLADALAKAPHVAVERDELFRHLASVQETIRAMDEVYRAAPWSRFFPSVTKSQPHIHATLGCRTLHATTVMSWAPALSGKTEAEAVEQLDEALCSVCFPSAPVALHEYVSKRSQAEQAARAAEKDERAAKLAAKQLTEAEQAQMGRDHRGDRVTTVARLKEIVRDAIGQAVELEAYNAPEFEARWTGDHANLADMRRRVADKLHAMTLDANRAAEILVTREAEHPGWGATPTDIDRMRANKLKSARKEWGL